MLINSIPSLGGDRNGNKEGIQSQIIPAPILEKYDSGRRLEQIGTKLIDFGSISFDAKQFKSV